MYKNKSTLNVTYPNPFPIPYCESLMILTETTLPNLEKIVNSDSSWQSKKGRNFKMID